MRRFIEARSVDELTRIVGYAFGALNEKSQDSLVDILSHYCTQAWADDWSWEICHEPGQYIVSVYHTQMCKIEAKGDDYIQVMIDACREAHKESERVRQLRLARQ